MPCTYDDRRSLFMPWVRRWGVRSSPAEIHCRRARDRASWKAVLDRAWLGLALGVSVGISLEALSLE